MYLKASRELLTVKKQQLKITSALLKNKLNVKLKLSLLKPFILVPFD